MCSSFSSFRQRTDLSKENLKHLEKVFRNHLAKDNEEFTLAEFKQIVPSKNVSLQPLKNDVTHSEQPTTTCKFNSGQIMRDIFWKILLIIMKSIGAYFLSRQQEHLTFG